MKTSNTNRLMVSILCGIAFWGTAIIANAEERYKGEIIKLWPKDVASQDSKGMGTMKPGRSEGSLRLTDITQPYLSYFPAPAQEAPVPVVIVSPGGGYMHIGSTTGRYEIAEWLNDHGVSADIPEYNEVYGDISLSLSLSLSFSRSLSLSLSSLPSLPPSLSSVRLCWSQVSFPSQS